MRVLQWDSLDACDARAWNELAARCPDATVFQRHEWIAAWWQTFRTGQWAARILAAFEGERLIGLLPVYCESGRKGVRCAYFLGREHADYQTVLWDADAPEVVPALLAALDESLPRSAVIKLEQVQQGGALELHLRQVSYEHPRHCIAVDSIPCPRLDLEHNEEHVASLLRKSSLRRHKARLASLGNVSVEHLTEVEPIARELDSFFSQHIRRWSKTRMPSLFLRAQNREFYRALTRSFGENGDVVLTVLRLDSHPAAYHFGMRSGRDLLWYKPSYEPQLARSSPGEVMLGHLIEYAAAKGYAALDFTRGDEPFKARFSSRSRYNHDYHLYRSALRGAVVAWGTRVKAVLRGVRDSLRPVPAVRSL